VHVAGVRVDATEHRGDDRRVRASLLALLLAVGCSAASAQPSPTSICRADADCVLHSGCCPACCACPSVVTRAQATLMDQACAVATCTAVDCSARSCRACAPVRPACVSGACVAH
jgi:hypothetical protein